MIIDYLKNINSLIDSKSRQKDFYLWQLNNAQKVLVKPSPIKTEKKHIHIKECYKNALAVTAESSECEFVAGYVTACGIPVEHAWNYHIPTQTYFDLTSEFLWKPSREEQYVQIFICSKEMALSIMMHRGFPIMGILGGWFYLKNYKEKG